jgi:hypothetical protein
MRKAAVILLLSCAIHFVGVAQAPPPPPPPAPLGGGPGTAVPIDNEVALLLFAAAFYGGYRLRKTKLAFK